MQRYFMAAAFLWLGCAAQATCAAAPAEAARIAPLAVKGLVLQAARAGQRLVAVGERGHVLLSDDQGAHWRQAAAVPTTTTLTALYFIDPLQGWAVGHGAVVLGTRDGGEHWSVLSGSGDGKQILFSVWFENAAHGFAVGPFGYAVETVDGGRSWLARTLADGDDGERHLNQIIAPGAGVLLIAAEAGTVLRSADNGRSWGVIKTPYKGSLWGGLALADGGVIVYGMRGHVLRSADAGLTWSDGQAGEQSFSGAAQWRDGSVVLAGQGGATAVSRDGARTFTASISAQRSGYSAVAEGAGGGTILFGTGGIEHAPAPRR